MTRTARINHSERIRCALEADIAAGVLPPGSRIGEQELMERFQVSRTPTREALLQLASAGLVVSVPRKGVVVAGLSLHDYISMLEMLIELEGLAARLAARRMTAAERGQLEAATAACRKAAGKRDASEYANANRSFHEIIYDGSRNEVLARQLRDMRLRMRNPHHSPFQSPGRLRHSIAEHEAVCHAILHGEEDAAERAMTAHISSGGHVYADAIATLTHGMRAAPARAKPARADAVAGERARAAKKASPRKTAARA